MKRIFLLLTLLIVFLFLPKSSFAQIYTTEKLITVDTGSQTLYAWEGGQIINQTKVSTGMRYTPTVKGDFRIWRKVPLQDMKGSYPPYPPYKLKDVPNVMFFYKDYAIHGTYWHNSFGWKASHGCVNVPVEFSKWLFDWAPHGARVIVF